MHVCLSARLLALSSLSLLVLSGVSLCIFGAVFPGWKLQELSAALQASATLQTSPVPEACKPHSVFGDLHCTARVLAAWNLPQAEKKRKCLAASAPDSLAVASAVNYCGSGADCASECEEAGLEVTRLAVTLFSLVPSDDLLPPAVRALQPLVFRQVVNKTDFRLSVHADHDTTLEYQQSTSVLLVSGQESRLQTERVLLPNLPMHVELLGGRRRARVGELTLAVAGLTALAKFPSLLDQAAVSLTAELKTALLTLAAAVGSAADAELKKKTAGSLVLGCSLAPDHIPTCDRLVKTLVELGRGALAPKFENSYGVGPRLWPWFANVSLAEAISDKFLDPLLNQPVRFLGSLVSDSPIPGERMAVHAKTGEVALFKNASGICEASGQCENFRGLLDMRRLRGNFFTSDAAGQTRTEVFIPEINKAAEFRKSAGISGRAPLDGRLRVEQWTISALEPRMQNCSDIGNLFSVSNSDCSSSHFNTLDLGLVMSPDRTRLKFPIVASYPYFQNVTLPSRSAASQRAVQFPGERNAADSGASFLLVEPTTGRIVGGRQTMQVNVRGADDKLFPVFIVDKTAQATDKQLEKLLMIQEIPNHLNKVGKICLFSGAALATVAALGLAWMVRRRFSHKW